MRWLELSVEAHVEAVEAVSEILGRVSAGTAVRPTRLIRDPNDELVAREDPDAPFVVSAHVADEPAASSSVEETERRCGTSRRSGSAGSAPSGCARSMTPTGPMRGGGTTSRSASVAS